MNRKNFRDSLAVAGFIGIPLLWLIGALFKMALPDQAIGATILMWGLIGQFYFRKDGPTPPT